MSFINGQEISTQAPDTHVLYSDLDKETRQKFEAAGRALDEMTGGPDPEKPDPIFGGAHSVHVAYADLDQATRQRVEDVDEALVQGIEQKRFMPFIRRKRR